MKWNKDEALKAKAIAETKFMAGDLRGSYKLALFARNLYPQLEGLPEMITAMQIHLTAAATSTGFDWYGILQVTAFSDISVVKEQYEKLTVLLHPAKNKSPIAEGAYRLIADAWACLSDPRAKLKYDGERRALIENHKDKDSEVAENHRKEDQTQKKTGYGAKKRKATEKSASSQLAKKFRKPDPEFSRKFRSVSEIAGAQPDTTSSTFLGKKRKPATCRKSKSNKKIRVSEHASLKEKIFCEMPETRSVHVEDSDFNDFDKERREECFEKNQLWALYDNKDLMPRWYGVIRDILSLNPFTARIDWLEANQENDKRDQFSGHFSSCGEFKLGSESTQSLNCFSHLMKGEKAAAGIFKIYPRKSSVWATYRNWKPEWDDSIPDETIQQYDIVEILTDFTVTSGGSVIPLVKVDGFKSIYKRKQTRSKALEWVKKDELLRFLHQIPCRRLAGIEADNLPRGCWDQEDVGSWILQPLDDSHHKWNFHALPLSEM